MKEAYVGSGKMINSEFLNNLDIIDAKKRYLGIIEEKKNWHKKNYV